MFFLEDLKPLATAKLQRKLQGLWTSDSFPECIREIYATTPESDRTMRSAVVKVAKGHVKELGEKTVFKDLIHEGGDIVVQYFESVIFPTPPAVSSTRPQTVGLLVVRTELPLHGHDIVIQQQCMACKPPCFKLSELEPTDGISN